MDRAHIFFFLGGGLSIHIRQPRHVERIDAAQSCRNFKIKLREYRNLHLLCKMSPIFTKPCFGMKHAGILLPDGESCE